MAVFSNNPFSYSVLRLAKEELVVEGLTDLPIGTIGIKPFWRALAIVGQPKIIVMGVATTSISKITLSYGTNIILDPTEVSIGDTIWLQYFY